MRQARNYGALNETRRQVDEERNAGPEAPSQEPVSRQPRSYGAVHQTQWQLDEQQSRSANTPERPAIVRSWTHYGGMVPQQGSANDWIKQNRELRMSDSGKGRGGEGASSPDRQQNDAELQQARAAVEEARQREAAQRARQQERERGGPER